MFGFPIPAPATSNAGCRGISVRHGDQVSYSIREAVLVEGVLEGMNLQAPCTVRAVKVSLPKLDIWEYVAADMVQAPPSIPDGAYEVSFDGRKMHFQKTAHGWVAGRG